MVQSVWSSSVLVAALLVVSMLQSALDGLRGGGGGSGSSTAMAQRIGFLAKSSNDLREWPQLLRKGVDWLSVDPHWMSADWCSSAGYGNNSNGCLVLSFEYPVVKAGLTYNTTENLFTLMQSADVLPFLSNPAHPVRILFNLKIAAENSTTTVCNYPAGSRIVQLAASFFNYAGDWISLRGLSVEFIVDGALAPDDKLNDCLLALGWKGTYTPNWSDPKAFTSNDPASGYDLVTVLSMQDSDLPGIAKQSYGKFINGSYPYLVSGQALQAQDSLVQDATLYLSTSAGNAGGVRFGTFTDPLQFSLYASSVSGAAGVLNAPLQPPQPDATASSPVITMVELGQQAYAVLMYFLFSPSTGAVAVSEIYRVSDDGRSVQQVQRPTPLDWRGIPTNGSDVCGTAIGSLHAMAVHSQLAVLMQGCAGNLTFFPIVLSPGDSVPHVEPRMYSFEWVYVGETPEWMSFGVVQQATVGSESTAPYGYISPQRDWQGRIVWEVGRGVAKCSTKTMLCDDRTNLQSFSVDELLGTRASAGSVAYVVDTVSVLIICGADAVDKGADSAFLFAFVIDVRGQSGVFISSICTIGDRGDYTFMAPRQIGVGSTVSLSLTVSANATGGFSPAVEPTFALIMADSDCASADTGICDSMPVGVSGVLTYTFGALSDLMNHLHAASAAPSEEPAFITACHHRLFHGAYDRGVTPFAQLHIQSAASGFGNSQRLIMVHSAAMSMPLPMPVQAAAADRLSAFAIAKTEETVTAQRNAKEHRLLLQLQRPRHQQRGAVRKTWSIGAAAKLVKAPDMMTATASGTCGVPSRQSGFVLDALPLPLVW